VGRETNKQRRQRQAASAREKAAAARVAQRKAEQRRRAFGVLGTVAVLGVVGAIIAVVAINSGSNTNQANDRVTAVSPVVQSVTSVTPAALQSVGPGSASMIAKPTQGDPPLTANGKPELLFVGGEFCPICAAERWSMVQALSRFGKFSNLSQIRSATTDGNLATFSFYKASYTSKYMTFVPVEAEDRNRQPLEKMTAQQQSIFSKYTNGFPFLYFGGKYVQTSAGFNPSDLTGLSWQQIAAQLKTPTSKVAQDILGEANNLTATICKMTNNQPSSVCLRPDITTLQSKLGA
jgi:hypothetical protein